MKQTPDQCSYQDHAQSLHRRAREEHARWLADASPEQLAQIRKLNLHTPPEDTTEVGGHSPFSISDIADSPLARTNPDISSELDSEIDILADELHIPPNLAAKVLQWHHAEVETAVRAAQANHLQIIIGGLLSSKNPKLTAAGLAFATNLDALNGLPSQRQFARENSISHEAISKTVRAWQRALGQNPSVHQKSTHACARYSDTGRRKHWRKQKVSAAALLKRLKPSQPSLN